MHGGHATNNNNNGPQERICSLTSLEDDVLCLRLRFLNGSRRFDILLYIWGWGGALMIARFAIHAVISEFKMIQVYQDS